MVSDPVQMAGVWPTPAGSRRADRRADISGAADVTRVSWSVELPSPAVSALTVASDGTIFVSTDTALCAVRNGRIAWSTPAEPFGGTVLLDHELFVTIRQRELVVSRQLDDEPQRQLPWPSRVLPAVANGLFVGAVNGALRGVAMDGTTVWSVALRSMPPATPLVLDAAVAVLDGDEVVFVDTDGTVAWRGGMTDEPTGLLLSPGRNRVLVAGQGPEGTALTWFDLDARSVRRVPIHLPPRRPFALTSGMLATGGWDLEDSGDQPRARLALADLGSGDVHQIDLASPLVGVAATTRGRLWCAVSPTVERWRGYRDFPGLADTLRCEVDSVDPVTRSIVAVWFAPGPITGPLAVGAAGEVLTVSAGQLFALVG